MTRPSPRVVAQHEDLWVLSKPSGVATHPAGTDAPTLTGWIARDRSVPDGLTPLHRLDLPTSGLVLAAEGPARDRWSALFRDRALTKTYTALVYGRTRREGTLRRSLRTHGRTQRARTRYRTLEHLGPLSLLEVVPETGRKHQIRRHLQGVGHPIVGDTRYGPRRFRPVPAFPGRLWLHACRLELPTGEVFEDPLPPALSEHLTLLRGIGTDAG